MNTAIASPLLSRFDLIFVLLDEKDREWDDRVSSFILQGVRLEANQAKIVLVPTIEQRVPMGNEGEWSLEMLRHYIALVRGLTPEMSVEANMVLKAYYRHQRRSDMSAQGKCLKDVHQAFSFIPSLMVSHVV